MIEWSEYVSQLLENSSSFNGISLSFNSTQENLAIPSLNTKKNISVPPIIQASILMLDKMQANQGRFNIFVFPERIQSIFIFTLVKLLYNISEGKIDSKYDPSRFVVGENLRLGKAVVKFLGIEERDVGKCIILRLADIYRYSASIDYLPLFQKTNAQRLSKDVLFQQEKTQAKLQLALMDSQKHYPRLLSDHKTHMDSSIVNMTSIINTKNMIADCRLCGQRINDAILVGQADYEGNVRNIGAGQLGGTPAIVLASDLYAISEMANKGYPIQSIIIDGSNSNALLSQLSALDELLRIGVSITCVTDVVNSFDLQPFLERGFNLWRWDESSLTDKLYNAVPLSSDRKAMHYAKRKVDYLVTDGNEISTAIKLLYSNRNESQKASAQMLKLFDRLFSIAFIALRETVPFTENQCLQTKSTLDYCRSILAKEKAFISDKIYEDYSTILDCLNKVFTYGFVLQKHDALANLLRVNRSHRTAFVIPEKSDKTRVQIYWQEWCRNNNIITKIDVVYPSEYYLLPCGQCDDTIIIGWLKRAIMKKALYSFNTPFYTVLLYDYEKRWKDYDICKWNIALDNSSNKRVIEKSFATDIKKVSIMCFENNFPVVMETPKTDELNEIETVLRESKYRQYITNVKQRAQSQSVEAVPVNYVGGYLAFYRTGHKIVCASKIIEHDADKIETKLPEELHIGDFVVVRETDHDLVKEIADVILLRSGKTGVRELSSKWKEVLAIETLFNSPEEIYAKLQSAGSSRGYQTVRSWILDEDMIAPQGKHDLEHIATMTGSGVLKEKLDQIFDAAQTVKAAHVQAGKMLTVLLRKRIVDALKEYGDIDPFNIWDPIEMHVDGIGLVRILKIIDIGSPVTVDILDSNRLIDE